MAKRRVKVQKGFSLIELMVSSAVLLVVGGAIFSALDYYQKTYVRTQLKGDMYFGVRGATDLLAQEIGQAGAVGLPPSTTLNTPVVATGLQTVAVTPAVAINSIFVGENLLIDAGPNEEQITVTGVNFTSSTITANFSQTHSSGAPVNAIGVFANGVMSTSTGTSLKLIGDINGDGGLYYVQYDCDPTAGTLTRSITSMFAAAKNPSVVLLDTLVPNPGGTACFTYASTTIGGNTFTTNVSLTLSVQTAFKDPQTGSYVQMTKNFLNLNPRNVLAGVDLANANLSSRIQPTPACGWGTC